MGRLLRLLRRRGSAAAAWTPASRSNLVSWTSPDSGGYSGTVTTLAGLGGTPSLVDASGAGWTWNAARYNGLPLFTSRSTASQMRAAFALPQPLTVYAVVRLRMRKTTRVTFDGGGTGLAIVYSTGTFSDLAVVQYPSFNPAPTPLGRLGLLKIVFDGSASSISFNGGAVATGDNGTAAPNGITIGNGGNVGELYGDCIDVGEVFAYTDRLNATDDARAVGYALGRWPLNGNNGKTVAWVGDSLTRGSDNGTSAGPWQSSPPGQMQANNPTWNVCNFGVDGQTASAMYAEYAATVAPTYNAADTKKAIVFAGGINDLATGTTPAALLTVVQNYAALAAATGWDDFLVCTLSDYNPATSSGIRAKIDAYEGLVNGAFPSSHIVPVTANALIGVSGAYAYGLYFGADRVHNTALGYGVRMSLAEAKLQALGY
jgi:hypothetical protein